MDTKCTVANQLQPGDFFHLVDGDPRTKIVVHEVDTSFAVNLDLVTIKRLKGKAQRYIASYKSDKIVYVEGKAEIKEPLPKWILNPNKVFYKSEGWLLSQESLLNADSIGTSVYKVESISLTKDEYLGQRYICVGLISGNYLRLNNSEENPSVESIDYTYECLLAWMEQHTEGQRNAGVYDQQVFPNSCLP